MKCIILAAGYATRMYPLTENFPKPLLGVGGKPILDWLVNDLEQDVETFYIVTNHKFAGFFNSWARAKEKITVIDDGTENNENRLGAVRDIQYVIDREKLNDDLLILAGDNVLDFSLRTFTEYAVEKETSCVMRYREEDEEKLKRSGISEVEGDRLIRFEEKPENPRSHWCTPPFYFYTAADAARIKEAIADGCGTDAPGSLVAWMCEHSEMHSMVMPGKRYDIGNLESYEAVKRSYAGPGKRD